MFKHTDVKGHIIIILLILLVLGGVYHFYKSEKQDRALTAETNLNNALLDSMKVYKDKDGQWKAEKKTLQASLSDLESKNIHLTDEQSKLIGIVKKLNKENQVINAALIDIRIKLDGIINDKPTETTDSTVTFATQSDSLTYEIMIGNIRALENQIPFLKFKKFDLPNEQVIEFHWGNERNSPISFSVKNSNPLYQVYNVESYAIPELVLNKIKPNFWQKLKTATSKTGSKIIILGAGVLIGAVLIN